MIVVLCGVVLFFWERLVLSGDSIAARCGGGPTVGIMAAFGVEFAGDGFGGEKIVVKAQRRLRLLPS